MPNESQTRDELIGALRRADKLIQWMSAYIGKMAPGNYADCFRDLNEHGIFMDQLKGGADD